ncbi:unnamed protein product [Phytophthora lilii]|uniref:Unnamed protein product n=1 Tax=Phytophthora lilii TaxID=2077276 RepID=A0A9W6XKR2_9STRA|nr:unnamed protein product [Phytophthora lilii]
MGFRKAIIVIAVSLTLTSNTQGGYVDLYRDAGYKHKLSRIEDVETDACYSFACDALDNTITSAKWGSLPEKTDKGEDAMIAFYTDRTCQSHKIWWQVKTQSDDDLHFPSNFRLDGINDDISAFMVWNKKKTVGTSGWVICTTEAEVIGAQNASFSSASGNGSATGTNYTIGYL